MNNIDLTERINNIIVDATEKVQKYLTRTHQLILLEKIKVPINFEWVDLPVHIFGKTFQNELVQFNKYYLDNKDIDFDSFLKETVLHEYAHIICLRLYNSLKHDNRFKYINKILGGSCKINGNFNKK